MYRFGRRSSAQPADVLVVCTGNVCRSPYITAILSDGLPELVIKSAGTGAMVGETADPEVLRILAERNVCPRPHRARSLTRGMVRGADLIITATRFHRTEVVRLDASASARAFTLKELARVTDIDTRVRGFAAVIQHAVAMANALELVDYDDDLEDPTGMEGAAYEVMMADVDAALGVLIPALREPMAGT